MSDYKYIIKADEINGGLEGFEIDEETKAGYECNGFVMMAKKEDGMVSIMNHVNLSQLIDWIVSDDKMMMAAKMALFVGAMRKKEASLKPVNIENLFGVD